IVNYFLSHECFQSFAQTVLPGCYCFVTDNGAMPMRKVALKAPSQEPSTTEKRTRVERQRSAARSGLPVSTPLRSSAVNQHQIAFGARARAFDLAELKVCAQACGKRQFCGRGACLSFIIEPPALAAVQRFQIQVYAAKAGWCSVEAVRLAGGQFRGGDAGKQAQGPAVFQVPQGGGGGGAE